MPTSRDGRSARTARKSSIVRTQRPAGDSIPTRTFDGRRVLAHRVDHLGDRLVRRATLADDDGVGLASAERGRGLEHERAVGGPEVRLARIVRTRPRDERVDFASDDTGVVEHLAQLLGAVTRLERGPVRLRRPERDPGEPAARLPRRSTWGTAGTRPTTR